MAHTKAKGTSKLGRDSQSKRLGVKIYGGQKVKCGAIIIRQRGTKYHPDKNVAKGTDDTLFAICDGMVKFAKRKRIRFDSQRVIATYVSVIPDVKSAKKENK